MSESRAPVDVETTPPLVGVVELPASRRVRSHTGRVARVTGWVEAPAGREVEIVVRWGHRTTRRRPELKRPDLEGRVGPGRSVRGFDLYLDLPRPLVAPVPMRVTFSDGEHVVRSAWFALMPKADLAMLDTYVGISPAMVDLAAKHLRGRGLEFGALHAPMPVDQTVASVVYADRLTRGEALETFFDMREHFGADFVDPEIIVDLDTSDLCELAEHDFDFFIANGVVEHVANPLLFLEHLERVMRPGSLFFVTIPDRDYTFDARRRCTSLEHLVAEYREGVTTISDDHVADMARRSPPYYHPRDEEQRSVLYDFHRSRSLHAHVWTEATFDRMLEWARAELGLRLEVVDRAGPRETLGNVVYVLRRTT